MTKIIFNPKHFKSSLNYRHIYNIFQYNEVNQISFHTKYPSKVWVKHSAQNS